MLRFKFIKTSERIRVMLGLNKCNTILVSSLVSFCLTCLFLFYSFQSFFTFFVMLNLFCLLNEKHRRLHYFELGIFPAELRIVHFINQIEKM